MSYKEIIDNVSNIEDLDNTTILKVLEKFSKTIKDFAIEQSGLNNLINVEFIPSDNNTTYTGNSVDYLGTLKLTLSDNIIVNKPCNIKFNIKSSNTIVVDVDEFNNSLVLNLDNSVVTTLAFAESERQKSTTDGAIVHEKQIADVEHIETIYDMNDSNKNIINNTAYTAGIKIDTTFDLDVSIYKKLKIYARRESIVLLTTVDLDNDLTVIGAANVVIDTSTANYYIYQGYTINKVSNIFTFSKGGYQYVDGETHTPRVLETADSGNLIYRIEGVR